MTKMQFLKTYLYRNQCGSVLMETVLVLPLYLAFFSGVFLIGDLILIRAKLTAGDRVAAWSYGNRNSPMQAGAIKDLLQANFFCPAEVGFGQTITAVTVDTKVNQWSWMLKARTDLDFDAPPWTRGWRLGALIMMSQHGDAPPADLPVMKMKSRELDDPAMMHTIVMRANYTRRETSAGNLANGIPEPIWYQEYKSNFLTSLGRTEDIPDSLNGVIAEPNYTRFGPFVNWSN